MFRMFKVYRYEQNLTRRPDSIQSVAASPERFPARRLRTKMFPSMFRDAMLRMRTIDWKSLMPTMVSITENIIQSYESLEQNPESPNKLVDERFLEELEHYAKRLRLGGIGYTILPQELIFRQKAVLFNQVIVLLMEMDANKLAMAPSKETEQMVIETYDVLGIAANSVANFLRSQGYAAQTNHPLGGVVLYPRLASLAGLGWHGRHGLLITPDFGPCVRIATVLTNIENLPISQKNPHQWIERFCYTQCERCMQKCPPGAIFEQPIRSSPQTLTHIDSSKCFSYFALNHGCSICIKECPFSEHRYEELQASMRLETPEKRG